MFPVKHSAVFAGLLSLLLVPSASAIRFAEDFESGQLRPPFWSVNLSDPVAGLVEVADVIQGIDASHSGRYGVALGRRADNSSDTVQALDLHLDLSGEDDVALSFWIKNNFDRTDSGGDGIWLSDNGGASFVHAYTFTLSGWSNTYGRIAHIALDRLAAAHGLAFSSQFVIRFQQEGEDDFSGTSGTADGYFLDDIEVVSGHLAVIPARLPLVADFEDGSFPPSIAQGHPVATATPGTISPDGIVEVADIIQSVDAAHSGRYGVALGRRADNSSDTVQALDLHLDLSGEDDVELSFWIKNNFDQTYSGGDGIWLSDNGGASFVHAYTFTLSGWSNSYGRLARIALDRLAADHALALTDRFVVRFQQEGEDDFTGTSGTADGYFLDDITVTGRSVNFARLPFREDFETGGFRKPLAQAHPAGTALPGTISPDGLVEAADSVQGVPAARAGSFGVALGRRTDNSSDTVQALDLHLDLSGEDDVELSFWIKNNFDRTDSGSDGIWLSDNGGQSFAHALTLDMSSLPSDRFERITVDIDALAAERNVTLSNRFIVRFQQEGEDDFTGTSGTADGYFLDDIEVAHQDGGGGGGGGGGGSDTCTSTATALCLTEGRFRVELTWTTPDGNSGPGIGDFLSSDTGFYYFFSPSNVEAIVKVLDGCRINDRFWVFVGGLTTVAVDIRIEDTETGTVRTYRNAQGQLFRTVADTGAFATCP